MLRGFFKTVGGMVGAVVDALITRPIKERGLLWTIAAWLLAASTLSFWGRLGELFWAGVVWLLVLVLFLKLHTKRKRSARPLPHRRRR